MFFNSNDYPKSIVYRNDRLAEARRDHLAKQVKPSEFDVHFLRRFRLLMVAAIALVILVTLPGISRAGSDMIEPDANEPFVAAITAYRLGHYYFVTAEYDKAIAYYTQAIDGIPAVVFEKAEKYRVIYWDMGDALLMNGQYEAALASYQHFLELTGETASQRATEFVERLEEGISQQVINLTPLAS